MKAHKGTIPGKFQSQHDPTGGFEVEMTPEFIPIQGKGVDCSDSSLQFIMNKGPPSAL